MDALVDELRGLIHRSAPDPDQAAGVLSCAPDAILDRVIPFSSLIVLGTIVAVEDHYQISLDRDDLANVTEGGATLERLARLLRDKLP